MSSIDLRFQMRSMETPVKINDFLEQKTGMRALWNTFNLTAAVFAIILSFGTWLYVSIDQVSFYGSILWSTAGRIPLIAFGLYIYFAVAFNLAASRLQLSNSGVLVLWLVLGSIVPMALGAGFVLLYAAVGFFFPLLFRIPIEHGLANHLAHITWVGFAIACLYSTYVTFAYAKKP